MVASVVRRRRRQPVERVQLLLACQHVLGGRECRRHQARLLRQARRIECQEDHAGDDGGHHADVVEPRQRECLVARPGQGQVPFHQPDGGGDGQDAEQHRIACRQRCGRDRDRRHDQEHEGVLDAAGQIQQQRQFDDVPGQQVRGESGAQPIARRVEDAQEDVHPRGDGNQRQAQADRKCETKTPIDADHRQQLTHDAEPP
jgi:hypothetical protein